MENFKDLETFERVEIARTTKESKTYVLARYDENDFVRAASAENPSLSPKQHAANLVSEDYALILGSASNPLTSLIDLKKLLRNHISISLLQALIRNVNCDDAFIIVLTKQLALIHYTKVFHPLTDTSLTSTSPKLELTKKIILNLLTTKRIPESYISELFSLPIVSPLYYLNDFDIFLAILQNYKISKEAINDMLGLPSFFPDLFMNLTTLDKKNFINALLDQDLDKDQYEGIFENVYSSDPVANLILKRCKSEEFLSELFAKSSTVVVNFNRSKSGILRNLILNPVCTKEIIDNANTEELSVFASVEEIQKAINDDDFYVKISAFDCTNITSEQISSLYEVVKVIFLKESVRESEILRIRGKILCNRNVSEELSIEIIKEIGLEFFMDAENCELINFESIATLVLDLAIEETNCEVIDTILDLAKRNNWKLITGRKIYPSFEMFVNCKLGLQPFWNNNEVFNEMLEQANTVEKFNLYIRQAENLMPPVESYLFDLLDTCGKFGDKALIYNAQFLLPAYATDALALHIIKNKGQEFFDKYFSDCLGTSFKRLDQSIERKVALMSCSRSPNITPDGLIKILDEDADHPFKLNNVLLELSSYSVSISKILRSKNSLFVVRAILKLAEYKDKGDYSIEYFMDDEEGIYKDIEEDKLFSYKVDLLFLAYCLKLDDVDVQLSAKRILKQQFDIVI